MKNLNRNTRNIYTRLIITYMLVLIGIIVAMECYIIANFHKEARFNDLENMKSMNQDVYEYLEETASIAEDIHHSLYLNRQQLQDVLWLLDLSLEEYYNKKLGYYTDNKGVDFMGVNSFMSEAISRYANIKNIALISIKNSVMHKYEVDGSLRNAVYELQRDMLNEKTLVIDDSIIFQKIIQDPSTFKTIGYIQVAFDKSGSAKFEKRYNKVKMLVYLDSGEILYATEQERFQDVASIVENGNFEASYGVKYYRQHKKDINYITYIDNKEFGIIPIADYIMFVLVGLLLLFIGSNIVNWRLRKLTTRLNKILAAMEKAMEGDLNIQLEVGHEDELDIISEYFNEMCCNLDSYIQKSYIAQIEQKTAEMQALQSQINPHFLYNTLEAIRMQAICNDDKEVGKMLYGLAVVFRSQIKEDNIITLAKEVYYCKKYVELFEFRYKNKFKFEFNFPEIYIQVSIIKFIIQPIIENYFVHGIRLEDENNILSINIYEAEDDLIIEIKDNGKGMPESQIIEKLNEMNQEGNSQGSIGLLNVHRRMVATYGNDYGLGIRHNNPNGLIVTIKIPFRGESNV
ncbi:histidine kinase [Lachnoclostridium sp.]|nr:histidine kinase [Lachnoclostridium sp.]